MVVIPANGFPSSREALGATLESHWRTGHLDRTAEFISGVEENDVPERLARIYLQPTINSSHSSALFPLVERIWWRASETGFRHNEKANPRLMGGNRLSPCSLCRSCVKSHWVQRNRVGSHAFSYCHVSYRMRGSLEKNEIREERIGCGMFSFSFPWCLLMTEPGAGYFISLFSPRCPVSTSCGYGGKKEGGEGEGKPIIRRPGFGERQNRSRREDRSKKKGRRRVSVERGSFLLFCRGDGGCH